MLYKQLSQAGIYAHVLCWKTESYCWPERIGVKRVGSASVGSSAAQYQNARAYVVIDATRKNKTWGPIGEANPCLFICYLHAPKDLCPKSPKP